MGMLFARRRKGVQNNGLTTTDNLLRKEGNKVESTKPQPAKDISTVKKETVSQPRFRQ